MLLQKPRTASSGRSLIAMTSGAVYCFFTGSTFWFIGGLLNERNRSPLHNPIELDRCSRSATVPARRPTHRGWLHGTKFFPPIVQPPNNFCRQRKTHIHHVQGHQSRTPWLEGARPRKKN